MSKLGKMLLYLALAGAIAALIAGGLIIKKRGEDAATLAQTQAAKDAADKATAKAKAETATATAAKADSDAKLATATTKIDDLNTQLTTAQKTANDAAAAVKTANDAAKTAQDALDAIKKTLGSETPEQYLADKTKAEADLATAQSEQKILQDQLQASQTQITDLKDAINRSKTGAMPGVSGKVTFVDRTWNFVVLDVGLSNGVVPNGELIVYRGRTFLGKVRVTKVDPNDAVAEILPDLKGDIQVGDSVLN
jgi:FtsZ-interacting cell division protein ZipA